ncbi:MAG: SDR family oxidoreductase [Proteobacteria bacterium]|nr:SDR family oxidoreductase [Pseudomonadota bacterium]
MLIGTLDDVEFAPAYPELAGKRVLITGVGGPLGVDVVRAFAETKARLVVQAPEDGTEIQALAEIIAPEAMDMKLYAGPIEGADAMLKFARDAAQKFGGLDCVINLAQTPEPGAVKDEAGIEALVADSLAMPVLATRVAVNRMRTMLSTGSIVNIVAAPRQATSGGRLLSQIARTALGSFTRAEAEAAATGGIRINAIVPAGQETGSRMLNGSADVATLALHLASGQSHALSGLVFEAYFG